MFDDDFHYHPMTYHKRSSVGMRERVRKAIQYLPLDVRELGELEPLISPRSLPDTLILTSARIREQAFRCLRSQLIPMWRSPVKGVERRWFFITIFADIGNALEYVPVLEFARAKALYRKALAFTGLHAFGVIEAQGITNFPRRGHGGTIALNFHGVGYTENDDFDAADTEDKFVGNAPLSNIFGAKPVEITQLEQRGALVRMAAYMLKAPFIGKYLVPVDDTSKKRTFDDATLPPLLALRLFEAQTYLDLPSATFAVRDGNEIKTPWLRSLRKWHDHHTRHRSVFRDIARQDLWESVWRCSHRRSRQALVFRVNTEQPRDMGWLEVSRPELARRRSRKMEPL